MRLFHKVLNTPPSSLLSGTKPLLILCLFLLLCISGLSGLKLSANYRVYFDPDSSLYQLDQSISEKYQLSDSLIIILTSDINFLDKSAWQSVSTLTDELQSLTTVTRVNSYQLIAESNHSQPYDETQEDEWQENKSLAERQKLYFSHPRAGQVLSQNGKSALIKIDVDLGPKPGARRVLSFNQSIEELTQEFQIAFPFIKDVQLGGVQALNKAYIEVVRHDLKFFIPALFLIFAAGLYYFYRDIRVISIILSCGVASVLSAFGVAGWVGLELAAINAFVPVIIVSISIATSAHLFTIFFQKLQSNHDVNSAIKLSIEENFLAILLSNLTTAAGFVLLLSSPSPPIRVVGILVATGTLLSYLCSQMLLPFLVRKYLKITNPKQLDTIAKASSLEPFKHWTFRHSKKAHLMLMTFLAISFLGFIKLEVNDNVYEYFPAEHSFSQTNQNIQSIYGGISRIVMSIDSGKDNGIFHKDYLNFVNQLALWISTQDGVLYVNNINQLIQQRGVNLNYLAKIASSESPDSLGISSEVSENYRESKLELVLNVTDAQSVLALANHIKNWTEINARAYSVSASVGPDVMFSELGKRNSESLFYSLILALVMIALLIGWLFRSFKITLLALICNIVPLTTVYAIWFLTGGYLSLGSSVMMGMIMGILVDDTIHLLVKYNHAQASSSVDPIDAMFKSVAPAILITSLTLIAGLLIGLLSDFRPIVELSGLSAATIFVALVIDLTLLPIALRKMSASQLNPK